MAFYISTETADNLTLIPAKTSPGCLRWLMGSFGLVAMVVGGGLLWLRSEDGADAVTLAGVVFLLIGAGFAGFSLFANFNPGTGVTAFVFDRHLGAVRVCSATGPFGPPAEAYLPYADITGVEVETKSHSSSSKSNGMSHTTYTYHAVLRLRDGASWLLTSHSTRDAADSICLQLASALVPRPGAGLVVPAPELPPQVTRSTQGRTTSLRWSNPVTRKEVGGKLAVLGGFGVVLSLFIMVILTDNVPLFVYGVLGFIAVVFVVIVVAQVRRFWQDATHRYGLEFSPEAVAYFEESISTGQETHRERIARADWYGLSYSFDPTEGENDAILLLTNAAHVQYLEQQQADSLSKGLNLLLEKNQSRTLRFKNFSPVQRLALVNWVHDEGRKVSM